MDVVLFGFTQHAGLAEDVLDHRLNCRTVYMNPVFHHALPKLHEKMKSDTPAPYPNLIAAWREILPALWRQRHDPSYFVVRQLPATARSYRQAPSQMT